MPRKLTKKQRGFVKDYIRTENGTRAILNNYDIDSPNKRDVAKSMASENLAKPYIQVAIKDAIPDELLAKVHLEGLQATTGPLDQPDYNVRHKYMDSGYKLKGEYAPEKHDVKVLDVTPTDSVKALAEKLNDKN